MCWFRRKYDRLDGTCPWGNRFRVHERELAFGVRQIGMPYVELDAPTGSAEKIARCYSEIMGASVSLGERHGKRCASVTTGKAQYLHFIETRAKQPDYDGHHIEIYIVTSPGPADTLMELGLNTMVSSSHAWRSLPTAELETGKVWVKRTTK